MLAYAAYVAAAVILPPLAMKHERVWTEVKARSYAARNCLKRKD
jgi:hypothetical protein